MQAIKKKKITPEWILERVSEWQVYKMYIPKFTLNRKIKSPFRGDDNTPSFSVFVKEGRIFHKDYGAVLYRGGCFDYVMQKFGITYPDALQKVAEDAGLVESVNNIQPLVWEQPELVEESVVIQAKAWGKWRKEHYSYLEPYFLTPEDMNFCSDTKCLPLKIWAVNGSRMPLDEGEVGFIYHLTREKGWVKVYMPKRKKEKKWRSSIPFNELHNKGAISVGCDVGILTKSLKEGAWINKYVSPCVEMIQAEDITALSVEDGKRIKESCKKLFVALDCDKQGKAASHALTRDLECFHINPPDSVLNLGGSDFTDWASLTDVQTVVNHFKTKGVIC